MTIIKVCGENIWPMYQILGKVLLKQIERNEKSKTYQLFGRIHLASSFSKSLLRSTSKEKSSSSISLGSKDTIIDKDTSLILV